MMCCVHYHIMYNRDISRVHNNIIADGLAMQGVGTSAITALSLSRKNITLFGSFDRNIRCIHCSRHVPSI